MKKIVAALLIMGSGLLALAAHADVIVITGGGSSGGVSNPATGNLDMGGFSITNVSSITYTVGVSSSLNFVIGNSTYSFYPSSANFSNARIYNAVISSTENVINSVKYQDWTAVDYVGSLTNNVVNLSSSAFLFGNASFSNSASSEAPNCVGYRWAVPEDIDTSVALTVSRWKFVLGNTDTGTQSYFIAYHATADSANPPAGSVFGTGTSPIALSFAGDGSGASGDIETVSNTTLTGWASALTAGQNLVITVCRDGDAAGDGSSVNSTSALLRISYGATQ